MSLVPELTFGMEVPALNIPFPAELDLPQAYHITMAAIDPTQELEEDDRPLATLKILRRPLNLPYDNDDDEDEDDFDIDEMDRMLADDDDDDDESEDEDRNGGPSDPSKSKKARLAAKLSEMIAAGEIDMSDDEDDEPNGINGLSAKARGKLPAGEDDDEDMDDDDEDDDDDDDDDDDEDLEEFVVCTLDPTKGYQQPLNITVGMNEEVYFKVTGGYNVHLTGNYVALPSTGMYDPDDDEDDEYDLEPDSDELEGESEEDELDDMEDPRFTEIDDEEDAPALIKANGSKGSKKRSAPEDDTAETLEEMMKAAEKKVNGEEKLSKKQLKKLKKNDGTAAAVEETEDGSSGKSDKKVSFAKNLEQGPTPTKGKDDKKAALGVKVVQGVTIDDKKLGTGPAAKSGDRVGMRYLGKLQKNGKVFDSNKKGKPFAFKLGSGEVIKGWDIGVAGMSVGGERRITIPAHLAYGSQKIPDIPANSTLIFDVKLLELNKGK